MNDTELDELLTRWDVPTPASAELRGKVWRAFHPPRRPRFWGFDPKPMFAGTALGAGLCLLLLITQAFPQTLRLASPLFRIPYTVDSEFVDYDEHGSPTVGLYTTSYIDHGKEVILSASVPGRPFGDFVRRILDVAGFGRYQISRRSGVWQGASDCLNGVPVVERATILGYSTVAVQLSVSDDPRKRTIWMAPELGCFAMKRRTEARQPDGTYRVVSEEHALAVTRTGE